MPQYALAINCPAVHWGYFALAVVGSLWVGLNAYAIHVPPGTPQASEMGKRRTWQKWFNTAGAAVGWLAGWVVLIRWLGCPGFVCPGEPNAWTILLAVLAFAGVVGLLPMTVMNGIGAVAQFIRGLVGGRA